MQIIFDAFSGSGSVFMYAITAVLAFGVAILAERAWMFWFRWRVDERRLLAQLGAGQLDEALATAGGAPPARLIAAGAGAADVEAAWDAMTAESALVESDVRARVPYLATVGNIATMLGLLGTVAGLIYAFSGLGDASAVERAARLSEGISAAMATTAWGLIVGIPSLAVHALLDGKASRMLALCEAAAARVALAKRS